MTARDITQLKYCTVIYDLLTGWEARRYLIIKIFEKIFLYARQWNVTRGQGHQQITEGIPLNA
jgi:hypothetical protein